MNTKRLEISISLDSSAKRSKSQRKDAKVPGRKVFLRKIYCLITEVSLFRRFLRGNSLKNLASLPLCDPALCAVRRVALKRTAFCSRVNFQFPGARYRAIPGQVRCEKRVGSIFQSAGGVFRAALFFTLCKFSGTVGLAGY